MKHHWPEEEPERNLQAEEPDLGSLLHIGKPLALLGYFLLLWSMVVPR